MAKHSKNFFDFRKSVYVTPNLSAVQKRAPLSLPIKIIISVLIVSLVLSTVYVSGFFISTSSDKRLLSKSSDTFAAFSSGEAIRILAQSNNDIKGWLKIDGTAVDYAVCLRDDEFYINHNQLGKKSRYGALFLSSGDTFERNGNDRNIMIYGNNMKDGTMFGTLKKYRNINFYKQNPCVKLYYGERCEIYIIFAVLLVSSNSGDNEGYNPNKSHFIDSADFNDWYGETSARSIISSPVGVDYGDDILTLVTVANDFEGARLAVMAKKTDEWSVRHTDINSAVINRQIKYPKNWYDERGLGYPY